MTKSKEAMTREEHIVNALDALLGALNSLKDYCEDNSMGDLRMKEATHWLDRAEDSISFLLHGEI